MKKNLNLLAYDFGASSGRAILGKFDGERIQLEEVHRFSNDPVEVHGRFSWDVLRLFYEMKQGLLKAGKLGNEINGIAIDTWGVDFGLLDASGRLVGNPVQYRDSRTDGMMEKAFEIMPKAEIFEHTGLAFLQFNTLYQLLAMVKEADPSLDIAKTMLMMPDLLGYFLTGEMATEYTIASTSQIINPATRGWDDEIISKFELPKQLFTRLQQPGEVRGVLKAQLSSEMGVGQIPVIAVGSHDTASAVAAVPAKGEDFAYISSGTWSLLGTELKAPLTSSDVMAANYTNEGGVNGTTRLLKNIMGLWIIQECKRQWDKRSDAASFAELVIMAEMAEPFYAMIDPDDSCFLAPGNMPERIQEYCKRTGQRIPEGRGQIARVVFESLALKYRWSIERLEEDILGRKLASLNIVGGGSKNALLNKFTAAAIKKPVIAGPSEGTAIGNLLVQAMALGEISSMDELRLVVANSFPTEEFLPMDTDVWDDAFNTFDKLVAN